MNYDRKDELVFRKATVAELNAAIKLLKQAAVYLEKKGINQWKIWLNPSADKIKWVKEGFEAGEFYFAESGNGELAGMFRLMEQDELYWGKQKANARYVHSLIVTTAFKGNNIGKRIIAVIEKMVLAEGINLLRLDCIASNRRLCAYYESLGFVKQGEKQMPHSLNYLYEKTLPKMVLADGINLLRLQNSI